MPSPLEAELFVYLSWRTRGDQPLLADDQMQQAAYHAVGTRSRFLSCRLLAIDGTGTEIHAVFSFPARFPVSTLAKISMEAAGDAICRLQSILYASPQGSPAVWERDYVLRTLNAEDVLQPDNYLRQRMLFSGRS